MNKIVIFASGTGTNAENIILHFNKRSSKTVFEIFTNNPNAKVIEKAKKMNVICNVFNKEALLDDTILNKLRKFNPDLIVLAGFLLKFPDHIIKAFPNKIINIHPALLPKYGGKGMYGNKVHQVILDNQEKETGITIHFVNEHYDEGGIIFQKATNIENCKSFEEIAEKVHKLEKMYFPLVIEKLINHTI